MNGNRSKRTSLLIDKITNSIDHSRSGKSHATDVLPLSWGEVKTILKRKGWLFNWRLEFKKQHHQLFKLVIRGDSEIQGILSVEIMDGYIEMHLIENAPHNRGAKKKYLGVAANLVAFACKSSFDLGFEGFVAFTAKTQLINHYATMLGAECIKDERMMIASESAKKLVNSYYKSYFDEGQKQVP